MAHMQAEHCIPANRRLAMRILNAVAQRLERCLNTLSDGHNAEAELLAIADSLIDAVDRARDVALASIYLNQIAGPYTVRHSVEVAIVCCVMARAAGYTEAGTTRIVAAALTMNASMVRVSEVFQLRDQALSADERRALRLHPADSAELLRRAGIEDEDWIGFVMMHHESDNGAGYPDGLVANQIPQGARLVGLADRYCALVSARNYRRSLLPPVASEQLCADCSDARLAALFLQAIGAHPPGTLVRLRNGDLGVVSSRGAGDIVHIHALRDSTGKLFAPPRLRSTLDEQHRIDAALHEDEAGLRFSMRDIWGDAAAV